MKLFLASEAKNPASFSKLSEYVSGWEHKTIAYIPTAANGEKWESWKEGGSWKLIQTLKARVNLVLLEEATPQTIESKIAGSDIIWFAGGMCGYLMYWIYRTQLHIHLPKLLEQGTVYVGSSAGSMISALTLDLAEAFGREDDHEYGAHFLPGLGLVDFDIYPHYRDADFEYIKANYHGNKLYLLKDGEAIIVEDKNVRVVGEERVITP